MLDRIVKAFECMPNVDSRLDVSTSHAYMALLVTSKCHSPLLTPGRQRVLRRGGHVVAAHSRGDAQLAANGSQQSTQLPCAVVVPAGPSRRLVLLAASVILGGAPLASNRSLAEELETLASNVQESPTSAARPQVYFDFGVDGKPVGRVVVEVFIGMPLVGSQRFIDLAQGKEGVGYRRSRINFVQDGFIQDAGVKSLSYKATGEVPIAGGEDFDLLEDELAAQRYSHDSAGVVSLVVRNREERVSKDKLVAMAGQLVTVTETFGELPNGTSFVITTAPQPELDETNLVVGRLVSGAEVVAQLSQLPRVKDNSSSPFFRAGKLAGDKRADVAERAFGKPFGRIFVTECGIVQ